MEIELPNGTILDAPDGLTPEQIKNIVRKHSPSGMAASHAPGAEVPGAIPPPPGRDESAARGGLQGLSFGWGDEGAAAIAAALPFTDREAAKGDTLGDRYRNARDFYRRKNAAAESANPGTYLAGQVAGATVPTLVGAPGAALKAAAGQGLAQGAGYSEREDLGLLGDTALGGALGLAGYGAGALVGKGLAAAKRAGANLVRTGTARAGAQAAGEVAEEIASAAGKVGGEVQKGSRQVENLMRLEASMTPQQRELYQQLVESGVVPNLQQSVAQSTLEALPTQASTIAARKAELAALQESAPKAATERTAQLLTPQVKEDIKSFLKSYAEPMAWAVGGQQLGSALGLDPAQQGVLAGAAGLIGGRTRAGKALWNRVNRPAHQAALGRWVETQAERASGTVPVAIRRAATTGLPAVVTSETTGREGDTGPQERYARTYGSRVPEEVAAWVSARTGGGE